MSSSSLVQRYPQNQVVALSEGLPTQSLQFQSFFDDQEYTDLTIKFSGIEIQAHRYVVTRKSSWFRKACSSAFKEARTQVVELHEDDSYAIQAMLYFIYDKPYYEAAPQRRTDLLFNIEVYKVADKYDIQELKEQAAVDFDKLLVSLWSMEHFIDAIRELPNIPTSNQGGGIHLSIRHSCIHHLRDLITRQRFIDVLLELPELAVELLTDTLSTIRDPPAVLEQFYYYCNECDVLISNQSFQRMVAGNPSTQIMCPLCNEVVITREEAVRVFC